MRATTPSDANDLASLAADLPDRMSRNVRAWRLRFAYRNISAAIGTYFAHAATNLALSQKRWRQRNVHPSARMSSSMPMHGIILVLQTNGIRGFAAEPPCS